MIKLCNKTFILISVFALIFLISAFALVRHNAHAETFDNDTRNVCDSLITKSDSLAYIHEHIDQNNNGMPDDLENGTDTIYQIILDNQKAIDEISVDLDRINKKLDELTASAESR